MIFLTLLLIAACLYFAVQNQDLNLKISDLMRRVQELESQLRRLHVKVVNQMTDLKEEERPAAPPVQPDLRPIFKDVPESEEPKPVQPPLKRAVPADRGPILPVQTTKPAWDFEAPSIDWEKFMGVQLFAWLGGFALFLGMAFFVKYSIDHNLISPLMRVIIGFVAGIGVIIGGLMMRSKGYAVTVQTLCAAGISILYADIYACRSFYNFLTPEMAFPLMILVTVTSFFLAVRLDSKYVAILGLIGGFLTPVLLSTGVDRPFALFSYIALLDVGLIAVAIKKRWGFLIGMSAAATLIMEYGWTMKFFNAGKAEIAFATYAVFGLLFVIAAEVAAAQDREEPLFQLPASLVSLASMGFVAYMLSFNAIAMRPGIVLTLLLLFSTLLAYMAVRFDVARTVYVLGGSGAFILLTAWTTTHLKSELLMWGLGYYMAFAIVHSAIPIILQRLKPSAAPFLWGYLAPILMLVLIFFAMAFCDILSFVMWPFVFLIGMLAISVAWLAGSILAAGATLAVIMASFGVWLFRLPDVAGLPGILGMLIFFSCAFFAWALVVTRKASLFPGNAALSLARGISREDAAQLPALSALMPFALAAMVCMKLSMPDPSQVFGLILLMGILLLGLVRYRGIDLVALVALLSTAMVEYIWHNSHFRPEAVTVAISWYFGFYALYAVFPFLFKKHLKGSLPWIAAALSGPVHFWLIYNTSVQTLGKGTIGMVPALFAALALMGLYYIVDNIPKTDERRNSLLAWFGGVALFFITLIIPIQFDKEWITLGWALEGAALLWLYQRVPHEGLKTWAVVLLMIAFARLAINPAVLSYHPRTAMPIFNWYLWVYGTAAICYFAAARWLKPPKNMLLGSDMPPILTSLGTILLFLLLNIEIADYFSTGATITFNFSSNFAQDVTYSLAWALFAIALLVAGIRQGSQGARYASIGLLLLTIVKVFLHDLWQLGQLFRVASFVGLAVVLILVSFLYQRFIKQEKSTEVRRV
jgi:hypothetical protein